MEPAPLMDTQGTFQRVQYSCTMHIAALVVWEKLSAERVKCNVDGAIIRDNTGSFVKGYTRFLSYCSGAPYDGRYGYRISFILVMIFEC
ncbi:hypothetical protein J1N35_035350 [Gossypium stocksii]|uniref:Uncharacterized protein n=1 Tax=Gossypium stocksii TaxID=47602 RepID=A0A9D3UTT3_9ROSI|nr:hypothetical protein J1N35_035350 [Gossypium stocksii]